MDTDTILQEKLIAAAKLLGLGKAVDILQAEREPVLGQATHLVPPPLVTVYVPPPFAEVKKHFEKVNGAAVKKLINRSVKTVAKAPSQPKGIGDGIESLFHVQPLCTVREVLDYLKLKHLVPDTGPATRKQVVGILTSDRRFAHGQAGGSYKLRTPG